MKRVARALGLLVALSAMATVVVVAASRLPRADVTAIPPPVVIERSPRHAGSATLLFLGDTGLGDAATSTLNERGYRFPFIPTRELLGTADLVVANHEMPISDGGRRFPFYKEYVYRARPESAEALAWAGVGVLELANNHITDFGDAALLDTIRLSRAAGMTTLGAGENEAEARRGVVVKVGDVRVGLLDYCERQLLWAIYVDNFARGDHAGAAALTEAALRSDIARLRPLSDVLVVSLHIGYNYEAPAEATLKWSRLAVDLGADLVVNHHPHVSHPLAVHDGKLIALSLGNYAFGTPGRPDLGEGEMLFVQVERRAIDRVEVVPIDVQNRRVRFAPRPLVGAALEAALDRLVSTSGLFGASLSRENGRAVWRPR